VPFNSNQEGGTCTLTMGKMCETYEYWLRGGDDVVYLPGFYLGIKDTGSVPIGPGDEVLIDMGDCIFCPGNNNPLGIQVTQRTYAWIGEDFIIYEFLIKNIGTNNLTDVYVGTFWDFDISFSAGNWFWRDDLVGYDSSKTISYMYDDEGDGGLSLGYIGIKTLNQVQITHSFWPEFNNLRSDSERYELMGCGVMDPPDSALDYCLLRSTGPFDLPSGRSIPVTAILSIGDGLAGLQAATSAAENNIGWETIASSDSILSGGSDTITVNIETKEVNKRLCLGVNREEGLLDLILVDPDLTVIDTAVATSDSLVNYVSSSIFKWYDIVYPKAGNWKMIVTYISGPDSIWYNYYVTASNLTYILGSPQDLAIPSIPRSFSLFQNYPNPFNLETKIGYNLSKKEEVTLRIYNILGQLVTTLVNEEQKPGYHTIYWDGRSERAQNVASGVYFYVLRAGNYDEVKKMVLLR